MLWYQPMIALQIELNAIEKTLLEIEKKLVSFDAEYQYKAQFICEEILTNLVRHADFEGRTPDVEFLIENSDEKHFQFICKDNSKAFNILNSADPDINAPLDDRELGGLGIYLSKKYAKTVNHSYKDGYNILKITL